MRKILVCQHVGYEILGTLNPLIKENGFRIRYINFGRFPDLQPNLDGYSGLILLGGPMNLNQEGRYPHLGHEIKMIEEALKKEMPILGICLGAQLIAKALGAEVEKNPVKEIGWYDVSLTEEGRRDPLLQHFETTEKIFQWHGDTFSMPRGGVHLAASPDCDHQAMRYGDKTYGFQFHLEVDQPMIERWLEVPRHQEELRALKGRIDPEVIKKQTPNLIRRSMALSKGVFGEFIKLFGIEKKYHRLPSR